MHIHIQIQKRIKWNFKYLHKNFVPARKRGSKLVPRAIPITQNMLSLILEEHPPRYFVDLILSKAPQEPIDTESSMYALFWEATTQNTNNSAQSALQLWFIVCTQLDCESGDTMFSDLDEVFKDTGVIGTLVRQCYLPPPPSEPQQVTTGSLTTDN